MRNELGKAVRGRKHMQESRATEFHQRLTAWKQTPESLRPSLRALARELGTSHQLLGAYLNRLDKWQRKEYRRRAEEIRKRAATENRNMTPWEESHVFGLERAAFHCMIRSVLDDTLRQIEQDAKAGQLKRVQVKMLKLAVRYGDVKAQKILQKCGRRAE